MSDVDTYLAQLRAHLTDLDPKRADEIVAEARTHLESRAAQSRAGGMSEEEASSEAARTFGEPAQVAVDLLAGNRRHRRPVALRAVGAFVTSFGSIFTLFFVIAIVSVLSRTGRFTLPAGLDLEPSTRTVKWVAFCCIALLTGIVGGRRFWWIAALPGFVMIGWALFAFSVIPPTVRAESGLSLPRMLVSGAGTAAMMASLGWLGSRLPRRRRLSTAITIVSGSVVGLIWVGLVVFVVAASIETEAGAWYFGYLLAAVMPVIVALLIAGRRDRFLSRHAFIAALSGLCGLGLLVAVALALLSDEMRMASRHMSRPLVVAGLICIAGLLASLVYTVRTRSTAGASLPPAEPK